MKPFLRNLTLVAIFGLTTAVFFDVLPSEAATLDSNSGMMNMDDGMMDMDLRTESRHYYCSNAGDRANE